MSTLKLQLLFVTCVPLLTSQAHGIAQFRQLKEDNKWRVHQRQDMYSQPRYFMWNPLIPQVYTNPNLALAHAPMTMNYHRYAIPPVTPMLQHHNSYVLTMPTAVVNKHPYQAVKDIGGDKRKPGNFHHVTIINAIMPKTYVPPPTTSFQRGPWGFRHYRNNKQLFYHHINPGRQTRNISKSRIILQHQPKEPTASALQIISSQMPAQSLVSLTHGQNTGNTNDYSRGSALNCGKNISDGFVQLQMQVQNYYCNLLNYYQDVTAKRETQLNQVLPTTNKFPIEKPPRSDPAGYATQKGVYVVPTVAATPNNISVDPTDRHILEDLDLKLKTTHSIPLPWNEKHSNNFFTLEDAITSSPPQNYVFNDPYEALAHARKYKENNVKRHKLRDDNLETTKHTFFSSFFDNGVSETSDFHHLNSPTPYVIYKSEPKSTIRKSAAASPVLEHNSIDVFGHSTTTTPYSQIQSEKITTTLLPNEFITVRGRTTAAINDQLTTKAYTVTSTASSPYDPKVTTLLPVTVMPSLTTVVSITTTTTTESSKLKKSQLKYPFFLRPTPAYKYQKPTRGLFKISKDTTTSPNSSTPAPIKKKTHKYQRQYKSQKNKHLKSSLQTPTKSTTTTESHNTTNLLDRTLTATSTTEATTPKTRKVKSVRVIKNPSRDTSRLLESKRNDKERASSTAKPRSRTSRRRNPTTSTTIKAPSLSPTVALPSTTTTTTMPSFTVTTMKSTLRKSNVKSKSKNVSNIRTSPKMTTNEVYDEVTFTDTRPSSKLPKSFPTRDDMVPPLPIEIYFKNSQNAKM